MKGLSKAMTLLLMAVVLCFASLIASAVPVTLGQPTAYANNAAFNAAIAAGVGDTVTFQAADYSALGIAVVPAGSTLLGDSKGTIIDSITMGSGNVSGFTINTTAAITGPTVSIANCTIGGLTTINTAGGALDGIGLTHNNLGAVTVVAGGTGTLDASDNFWQCDNGPTIGTNYYNQGLQGSTLTTNGNTVVYCPWLNGDPITDSGATSFAPVTISDPAGMQFSSIQAAVDASNRNGTVVVAAGEFNEQVNITTADAEGIQIIGAGNGSNPVSNTILIREVVISQNGFTTISPLPQRPIMLSNLRVTVPVATIGGPAGGTGVTLNGVKNVTLDNVTVFGCAANGIKIYGAGNETITIQDCTIDGNSLNGIQTGVNNMNVTTSFPAGAPDTTTSVKDLIITVVTNGTTISNNRGNGFITYGQGNHQGIKIQGIIGAGAPRVTFSANGSSSNNRTDADCYFYGVTNPITVEAVNFASSGAYSALNIASSATHASAVGKLRLSNINFTGTTSEAALIINAPRVPTDANSFDTLAFNSTAKIGLKVISVLAGSTLTLDANTTIAASYTQFYIKEAKNTAGDPCTVTIDATAPTIAGATTYAQKFALPLEDKIWHKYDDSTLGVIIYGGLISNTSFTATNPMNVTAYQNVTITVSLFDGTGTALAGQGVNVLVGGELAGTPATDNGDGTYSRTFLLDVSQAIYNPTSAVTPNPFDLGYTASYAGADGTAGTAYAPASFDGTMNVTWATTVASTLYVDKTYTSGVTLAPAGAFFGYNAFKTVAEAVAVANSANQAFGANITITVFGNASPYNEAALVLNPVATNSTLAMTASAVAGNGVTIHRLLGGAGRGIEVDSNNVTVNGFTLVNTDTPAAVGSIGIGIINTLNTISVLNNIVQNFQFGIDANAAAVGNKTSNWTISGNTVYTAAGLANAIGIRLRNGDKNNTVLTGNTVTVQEASGIGLNLAGEYGASLGAAGTFNTLRGVSTGTGLAITSTAGFPSGVIDLAYTDIQPSLATFISTAADTSAFAVDATNVTFLGGFTGTTAVLPARLFQIEEGINHKLDNTTYAWVKVLPDSRKEIYVTPGDPTTGAGYLTRAIALAQKDWTIIANEGTYFVSRGPDVVESIIITKPLTLYGIQMNVGAPTRLGVTESRIAGVTIAVPAAGLTSANVTINGFTIDNGTTAAVTAAAGANASFLATTFNNNIVNTYATGAPAITLAAGSAVIDDNLITQPNAADAAPTAMVLTGLNNQVVFTNNTIYGAVQITALKNADLTVKTNTIAKSTGNGLLIDGASLIDDVDISSNTFRDNVSDGLKIDATAGLYWNGVAFTMTANTFDGNNVGLRFKGLTSPFHFDTLTLDGATTFTDNISQDIVLEASTVNVTATDPLITWTGAMGPPEDFYAIEQRVWHMYDDPTLGLVLFEGVGRTPVTLTVANKLMDYVIGTGGFAYLTAAMSDGVNPVSGKSILFKVGGTVQGTALTVNGTAIYGYTEPAGLGVDTAKTIIATFAGDPVAGAPVYQAASGKGTLEIAMHGNLAAAVGTVHIAGINDTVAASIIAGSQASVTETVKYAGVTYDTTAETTWSWNGANPTGTSGATFVAGANPQLVTPTIAAAAAYTIRANFGGVNADRALFVNLAALRAVNPLTISAAAAPAIPVSAPITSVASISADAAGVNYLLIANDIYGNIMLVTPDAGTWADDAAGTGGYFDLTGANQQLAKYVPKKSSVIGTPWKFTASYGGATVKALLTVTPGAVTNLAFAAGPDITIPIGTAKEVVVNAQDAKGNIWPVISKDYTDASITLKEIILTPGSSNYQWTNLLTVSKQQLQLHAHYTNGGNQKDAYANLTLTNRTAAGLTIDPVSGPFKASDTVTFVARANDGAGTSWDVSSSCNWTIDAAAAGTWTGAKYATARQGTWTVTATYGGLTATTPLIVQHNTTVKSIAVTPGTTTTTSGTAVTYTATAFDGSNNSWDISDVATWAAVAAAGGGSFTKNVYTAGNATAPLTPVTITATYNAQTSNTAVLTITAGGSAVLGFDYTAKKMTIGGTQVTASNWYSIGADKVYIQVTATSQSVTAMITKYLPAGSTTAQTVNYSSLYFYWTTAGNLYQTSVAKLAGATSNTTISAVYYPSGPLRTEVTQNGVTTKYYDRRKLTQTFDTTTKAVTQSMVSF